MGKRTQAGNALRREEIERHVLWASQKEAALGVLISYSRGCHAYAAWPDTPVDPEHFNYAKISRLILVPPLCDEEVVLPAGSCRVIVGKDKGSDKIVCLMQNIPDKDGKVDAFYVDVDVGLEIVLPGNKISKLVRDGQGEWDVEEPPEL